MTPINGIYQHDFYENIYQSKNKKLCFICNKPRYCHINSTPGNEEEPMDNIIDNYEIIIKDSSGKNECKVCYEVMTENEIKFNSLP